MRKLIEEIHEWQKTTFPKSDALSKLEHLKEEVDELEVEVQIFETKKVEAEFADCFILLFGAAFNAGFTFENIERLIQEKFEVNKGRDWGEPDEKGVIRHKK